MAQVSEIKATARPKSGKGAARQARVKGIVPGVIYGAGQPPEGVLVDYRELFKLVHKGRFLATVFDVNVEGKTTRVLPRDVQFDPVKDFPIHVDFQRIAADGRIRVAVPMRFKDELLSPGLKRGGVLNVVRHEVEVYCPAESIPHYFEASLEGLEIGRSIHISAFNLPADIKTVIQGRDFTVATIAGAVKQEAEETTPGATPAAPGDAAAAPAAAGAAAGAKAPAAAAGGKAPAAAGAKAPAGKAPAGGDKKK